MLGRSILKSASEFLQWGLQVSSQREQCLLASLNEGYTGVGGRGYQGDRILADGSHPASIGKQETYTFPIYFYFLPAATPFYRLRSSRTRTVPCVYDIENNS